MVQRYPQVGHWEPWNEPNLAEFSSGTFSDYFNKILKPASEEIRAACPTCKVVGPILSNNNSVTAWYNMLGRNGGGAFIDVISHNYYGCSGVSCLHSKWTALFNLFDSTEFSGKPVWITETGDNDCEPCQAEHLIRMITYMIGHNRIQNLFVYRLRENGWYGLVSQSGAVTRLAYAYLVDIGPAPK